MTRPRVEQYGPLRPATYRPRIVDEQIRRYLRLFGAVEVSGTKWCGKTWSSLAQAQSVTYVDRGANLEVVKADPAFALAGDRPHVIDEWQRVPAVWDTVRHAVDDAGGERGAWILTGSSTPRKDEVSHSGAGRIGRIHMHPLTLQESADSGGVVSLRALFDGEFAPYPLKADIAGLADLVCRGGWPDAVSAEAEEAQVIVRSYLTQVLEQSIPRLGGDRHIAERLCRSLARNVGQSATNITLALDVFGKNAKAEVSDSEQRDVSRHLELLRRIYLIDEIEGWVPASRSPKRMRVSPKRYFADPSIAVALLGMNSARLLEDWQTFGLVFENLVMRDLLVYTGAHPLAPAHSVKYYHDDSNLEVDAILELADGRWAACEIKLSHDKVEEAAGNLLALERKLMRDDRGRVAPPTFLAVIVGVGEAAYRRQDGVYVIPIRALGA